MSSTTLTRQYIRDAGGKQIGVILPIEEYQALVRLQPKAARRTGRSARPAEARRHLCMAPSAIWAEQSLPPGTWMKPVAICGRYGIKAIELLDKPESQLVETPVSRSIITSLLSISRETVPDMPDRVIAATALSLAVPVISRDGKIRDSQIETIW